GVDLAVPEVPDQQVAAEPPEVARGERKAPWRIELAAARDAPEQLAVGVEHVDESEAPTGDVVLALAVLLGERHEDPPADRLDAERRKPLRDLAIDERPGRVHVVELVVEDVDAAVVEVRGKQPTAGRGR